MFWFMFVLFFVFFFCVSCFCLLFFLVILPVVLLFGDSVFDCFFFVYFIFANQLSLLKPVSYCKSMVFDMIPKWSHWYHRNLIYDLYGFTIQNDIYHQLQLGRYVMETIGNHNTISGFVPKMGMPRTWPS